MNLLFIGGSGNLSTACAALLHQNGHKIYILSRGQTPIPSAYTGLIANRQDRQTMVRLLQGIQLDVVLNFLGYTVADVEIDYSLFNGKIKQYIFISSATVYAKPHRTLPITEQYPLGNPFSEYAQNKQACEEWLLSRFRQDQFPVTVIRPSHTYSCRWIPNIVNSTGYTLLYRLERNLPVFIHNDGQSLWTLTAADDFAVGVAGLVGLEQAIGETVHITSDQVLTWNQIYEEICRAGHITRPTIMHIPIEFICQASPEMSAKLIGDKAEPGVFDNAKIKKLVADYDCRKTFRQGIAEAAAWFRQDPRRMQPDSGANALFDKVTQLWMERK